MQKILIVTYFFPPCNLTAANRAASWVKDLPGYSYYPIVLTRKWETPSNDLSSISNKTTKGVQVDKYDTHSIISIPHRQNLRDYLLVKYGQKKYNFVRKILTFFQLIFQNVSLFFSPYYQFYTTASKLIKDEKIDKVIISGSPFQLFKVGYLIKKKFPHIEWIADYRDEWTTRPNFENKTWIKISHQYNQFFEKHWLKNVKTFTYPNESYINRIESLTGKEGVVLMNGFIPRNENIIKAAKDDVFEFTYTGTLYNHQNIDFFLGCLKEYVSKNDCPKIRLNFIGSTLNPGIEQKVKNIITYPNIEINFTSRLNFQDLDKIFERTDILLMFPIKGMEGVVPTKVFDYLSLNIPILFCPSDNGQIEKLLLKSNTGYAINTKTNLEIFFDELFKSNNEMKITPNWEYINQFSRSTQTRKIVEIFEH